MGHYFAFQDSTQRIARTDGAFHHAYWCQFKVNIAGKKFFRAFKFIIDTVFFELMTNFIQNLFESLILNFIAVALQKLHMVGSIVGEVRAFPRFSYYMCILTIVSKVNVTFVLRYTNV